MRTSAIFTFPWLACLSLSLGLSSLPAFGGDDCKGQDNGTECDDGNFCTGPDRCYEQICSGFNVSDGTDCPDDGNECTLDQCFSGSCGLNLPSIFGCTDDGNDCTFDVCSGTGNCIHPPKPQGKACAPDKKDCTDDVCDGAGNCTHPNRPVGSSCTDDGNPCTGDVCDTVNNVFGCTHPCLPENTECTTVKDEPGICVDVESDAGCLCIKPKGSCTTGGGECDVTTEDDCDDQGGVYGGDLSTCDLLDDDFDDDALDPVKWTTVGNVAEENMSLRITDSGFLNTVDTFDPSDKPLDISVDVNLTDHAGGWDRISIATRSDGVQFGCGPNGCSVQNGIVFTIDGLGSDNPDDDFRIERLDNGIATTLATCCVGEPNTSDEFAMRVTDDGATLRLYISYTLPGEARAWELMADATDATIFLDNLVTFFNSANNPPSNAILDNVAIDQLNEPDLPPDVAFSTLDNTTVRAVASDYGTSGQRLGTGSPIPAEIAWLEMGDQSQVFSWEGNLHYDEGSVPTNHLLSDPDEFTVITPADLADDAVTSESSNDEFLVLASQVVDGNVLLTELDITNVSGGDLVDVQFAWMMDGDLTLPANDPREPCCEDLPWIGFGRGRWFNDERMGAQINRNDCAGVVPAEIEAALTVRVDGMPALPDEWTVGNPSRFLGSSCGFDGDRLVGQRYEFERPYDNTEGCVGDDQDLAIVTNYHFDNWAADETHTFTFAVAFSGPPDSDADTVADLCDNCPDHANTDQADCDVDGVGDVCALATGFSRDCNGNDTPDNCDLAGGGSVDLNDNGIPDECDASITDLQSMLVHDEGGPNETTLSIDLDNTNGIEPRLGGPRSLQFTFSRDIDAGTVATTSVQFLCAGNPGPAVTAVTPGPANVLTVDTAAFADEDCCTVRFIGVQTDVGGTVEDTRDIKPLAGDVNFSGGVTGGDALLIKPHFGESLQGADLSEPQWDFNLSGAVTGGDFALIKPRFGNLAPACP